MSFVSAGFVSRKLLHHFVRVCACSRGYMGGPPPHQGPPMHMAPPDMRGPHDMRGAPMLGEPRGPMMDQRGPPMDSRGTS